MAPIQVPLTPEQQDAYAPLKTPEERRRLASPSTPGASLAGRAAQLVVLLCMAFYIFGEVLVLTPLYNDKLAKTLQTWWGAPRSQGKGGTKGHMEMVRWTYFTLFSVLPLMVIIVLVEFLRKYNARRLTSQFLLKVALVLRRKPALFGRVSYWSFGEWIFFFAVVIGNVYVFVRYYVTRVKTKKPKGFSAHLECVGLSLGFTCLFNMAFLFLPATRNSAWMEFFNISYANSVKYHRWLGVVTVATAFLHGVCYYWSWIREGEWVEQAMPCFNCDLSKSKNLKRWQYVFGQLSFIVFALMGVTAIPFVRRQFYNVFYYTHQLLFLTVVMLALHWQYSILWLLPTLVLYCLSRSVSFVNGYSPVEVVEVTALSEHLVKVVFKRSPGSDGAYQVGQFLYLNVPAISKLQWHAFTVASSPRASPTTVTVLLKSLGDWTKDLVAHANECKEKNVLPTVYVDAFYGASLEMYDEYSTVCLVAGGIGVTPILAILNDMVAKLSAHGSAVQQKVVFIFAFRELALLEEVAPVLVQLRELDPQQRHVSFHLTLTGSVSDDSLDTKLAGRAHTVAEPTAEAASRRTFSQPLRATSFASLAALAAFGLSLLLLGILEYGTKIKRLNARLSLLEWFVEICVVLGAAFVAVVAVVLAERKLGKNREPVAHAVQDLSAPFTLQNLQVTTYRQLLAELGVVVGAQPEVAALLRQAHAQHDHTGNEQTAIGVFTSGPESLKRAVELAVAAIDSSAFDLREEQFEL